jgi:hypothetical protein
MIPPVPIHTGVLENRILLGTLRSTAVVEDQEVGQGDTAVDDLSPDKDTERAAKLQLTIVIQECRNIIL